MSDGPSYYTPKSRLPLYIAAGSEVSVTIVHAFSPSISQVFVVRIHGDFLSLSSGSLAILKVYDPRFHPDRKKRIHRPQLPWTYDNEAEAARRREAQPATSRFEPSDVPDDDDPVAWENYYYQCTQLAAWSEIEAYQRLAPLQGTAVPICYTPGKLNLSGLNTARAIIPPILLLEFLHDAKTFKEVDNQSITPSLIRSLFQTVTAFGKLGVSHNNLHAKNILFAPGRFSTRAVIIDFGSAYVLEEESEDEWKEIVAEGGDLLALRTQFRQKLGHDKSEYLSEVPAHT